jgi:hypothetical protein
MAASRMTPNQLVAFNLWRARTWLGLTQEKAAELTEPYLGERWSKRSWSAAERSMDGKRIKVFSADEIVAFAAAFDLPLSFFFAVPAETATVAARDADKGLTPHELVEASGHPADRHLERIGALQEKRRVEHMRKLAELGIDVPGEEEQ